MCGIVAIVSSEGPVSQEALGSSVDRLRHRGPDGQGCWFAPNRRVALGHARLSVIDLEGGRQPIANEDESLHLIVNGEFYGFESIRKNLEQDGHRFRTRSDSEIALHLYEEEGPGCLRHLRGEFAFVLWDERKQALFAARDRFGIKPLFYACVNGILYLASEVKALFAAGVPAHWDHQSFYQQLFVYQNKDRTLFKGVYQVPPGCYLSASGEQMQICRYWDLDYPRAESSSSVNETELISQVQASLQEAVRVRLRADVPVGCFLSGGLDSSAVLGLATREYPDSMQAYNISFDQRDFDEKDIARQMAAHAGAQFDSVSVSHSDIAEHLTDTVIHGETLGVNWHAVARFLLCRAVHDRGIKVVLSGEGADELFAGYLQFRQDLLLNDGVAIGRSVGARHNGRDPCGVPGLLGVVQGRLGFVPAWLKKLALGRSVFHLLLSSDYSQCSQENPFEVFVSQFDVEGQLQDRSPFVQSLYLWTKSILPNYILFAERLEMAHAVEVRIPFLDHKVFELVRNVPGDLLIRGAKEKYILREAVRPWLTDTVYRRPKHPFFAPPLPADSGNRLQCLVQDTLRGSVMAAVPFFDQSAVISLLDQMPSMDSSTRIALDPAMMMLVCTCILQSHYGLS